MRHRTWTDEQLALAVKNSTSVRQVLFELGLAPKGGNYATMKRNIARLNLDTSHFNERTHGLRPFRDQPIETYLVKNSTYDSVMLKKRLLSEGLIKLRRCNVCHLTEWRGQPIELHLDHINGDNRDNRLKNLQLLCPNCHSQTPTYCGRNIKRK